MAAKINIWTETTIVPSGSLITSMSPAGPPSFVSNPIYSTSDTTLTVLKYKTENMSLAGLNITINLSSGSFPSWSANMNMSKDSAYNYYDTGIPTNVDHYVSGARVTAGESDANNWTELTFNSDIAMSTSSTGAKST